MRRVRTYCFLWKPHIVALFRVRWTSREHSCHVAGREKNRTPSPNSSGFDTDNAKMDGKNQGKVATPSFARLGVRASANERTANKTKVKTHYASRVGFRSDRHHVLAVGAGDAGGPTTKGFRVVVKFSLRTHLSSLFRWEQQAGRGGALPRHVVIVCCSLAMTCEPHGGRRYAGNPASTRPGTGKHTQMGYFSVSEMPNV